MHYYREVDSNDQPQLPHNNAHCQSYSSVDCSPTKVRAIAEHILNVFCANPHVAQSFFVLPSLGERIERI